MWLGRPAKEHWLSVGKDCAGSNTEVSEARPLPQVMNSLKEKRLLYPEFLIQPRV